MRNSGLSRKSSILHHSNKQCQICSNKGHEASSCATVPTLFEWFPKVKFFYLFRKYGGQNVFLCGSFSQWAIKKKLEETDKG